MNISRLKRLIGLMLIVAVFGLPRGAAADGDLTPVLRFEPDSLTALAWSHDGSILAVGTQTAIHFYDARFNAIGSQSLPEGYWNILWQPGDKQVITFTAQPCRIRVWRVLRDKADAVGVVPVNDYPVCARYLRWSHDGRRIAILSSENALIVIETSSVPRPWALSANVSAVDWQRNGDSLAYTTSDGTLIIWDADKNQITRQIPGAGQAVEWAPDDSQFATVITRGSKQVQSPDGFPINVREFNAISIWDVKTGSLSRQIPITDDLLTAEDVRWLPDNRVGTYCHSIESGFTGDHLCIWDIASGSKIMEYSLGGGSSSASNVEWSPDRRRFYSFLYWQGVGVRIGKLDTTDTGFVPIPERQTTLAAWMPDSQHLTVADQSSGGVYQVSPDDIPIQR